MRAMMGVVAAVACACSGRVDVDNDANAQRGWEDPSTLTVCVAEGETSERLSKYVLWAVHYWQSYGEQVAYQHNPYCLVRVSVSNRSKAVNGWGDGEIAQEIHRTSGIDQWAPASITQRKTWWDKASDEWRYQSMAHELGHALGHQHSDIMPMRSCEEPEWCFGEAEVQRWLGEL
jgi:hypothetical protein